LPQRFAHERLVVLKQQVHASIIRPRAQKSAIQRLR
jgi:hypothetical protein